MLNNEREHQSCGCDGCAEALPVPEENEGGERCRERLDREEGAGEEGDGAVQGARASWARGGAGTAAIGGPARHQHPFDLGCEGSGERDAERERELGAHRHRYRRETRLPREPLERERVPSEPGPLVRVNRLDDDPPRHVLAPQPADETGVGRMEVEDAQVRRSRVREAVAGAGRRREERARAGPPHLVADHEVGLAGEHVKRVDEVVMRMGVDALELRAEGHLDHGELGQLGLDAVRGVLVLDRLAGAGRSEDRVFERPASVFGRVELVEMLMAATAEDVAEAHARCVNVEEERGCVARVPEGMYDVRWRAREGFRSPFEPRDLRAEAEVDLSLEDVERVRVLAVDVGVRAFLAGLVAEERDDQLVELAEDRDRPLGAIGGRLTLAGG